MIVYAENDSSLDVGPYFGTNEHPRRDTDVISRLSKSTIEDLSIYKGFVKESIVKIDVFGENDLSKILLSNISVLFSICFWIWGSF